MRNKYEVPIVPGFYYPKVQNTMQFWYEKDFFSISILSNDGEIGSQRENRMEIGRNVLQ
jgi:hypothetical protein